MIRALTVLAAMSTAAAAQVPPTPTPPAPPRPPANCTAPEHRQFDFWIGEWDVSPTAKPDQKIATSLIESVYNGCGIRENWRPFSLSSGGSLNSYDPTTKHWHQSWIDSSNARVSFTGGLENGKMVLTGEWKGVKGPGKDGLIRMTYSRGAGGAVRQLGEISTDGGKTWGPSFDLTYRPMRKAATP